MEILEKIDKLRIARGWSVYKLAEESMLSQSTLANMFTRKTMPTFETLKSLCNAFGITLSQFFAEENEKATVKEAELIKNYRRLSENNQEAVLELIKNLK